MTAPYDAIEAFAVLADGMVTGVATDYAAREAAAKATAIALKLMGADADVVRNAHRYYMDRMEVLR